MLGRLNPIAERLLSGESRNVIEVELRNLSKGDLCKEVFSYGIDVSYHQTKDYIIDRVFNYSNSQLAVHKLTKEFK